MSRSLGLCVLAGLIVAVLFASQFGGQVTFNALPVPGATVTAAQTNQHFSTVTDPQGLYTFPNLPAGTWTISVEKLGFAGLTRTVVIGPTTPPANFDLKLLPLDQIQAGLQRIAPPSPAPEPAPQKPAPTPEPSIQEFDQRAADGLLINGSTNNGAASPFAQMPAFGNNRNNTKSLYTGGIGMILDNSALDASPFSLTGQQTPKPSYSRVTGLLTLGGPLRIPHLFKKGPNFFVAYQWTRNNTATDQPALVPTLAERSGIFTAPILDPSSNAPFPRNTIPSSRISPQAQALLNLYPLPNFTGPGYNYQVPLVSPTHQDALQSRFNQTLNNKNQLYGRFAFQSTRTDNPNLFGFLDTTDIFGLNTSANWAHRFGQHWFLNLGTQFSRLTTRVTPYFENRANISADAGISGNDQDPRDWGPPTLNFASGIASLTDSQSAFNRNQTTGSSYSMLWNRGAHNITFGTDFRREEFNYLAQQDPRGAFTFTGGAAGNDFADFLLGIPDTSSIAFGNADKYFRESVYDAFLTDDWRINPELTLNAGLRWEYGSPITELYGRLVNLDIAPGFTAVTPIVAAHDPNPLIQPDKRGIEPRIGIAWRPISGSSLVLRAGYGVYYDTSVYQTIALQMAQQPPLSKSFSVANTPADPLTLAGGFNAMPTISNTFAINPDFRIGYAQNWQAPAPARSARISPAHRDVSRHQRHSRTPGVPAQYLRAWRRESLSRLPRWLRLSHLQRQLHARSRPVAAPP